MSQLNVSGIANVIVDALRAFDRNIGAPECEYDEQAMAVVLTSVQWVLDNPMSDEFGLLRAWGVAEPFEPIPNVAVRAGLVRVIALELGGEF